MSRDVEYPALVTRLDARGCLVRLDEPLEGLREGGYTLWCSVRGRIHLRDRKTQKSPVAVGDRVTVIRSARDRGSVVEIQPRTSTLSRPAARRDDIEHVMAANVDQAVVVSSATQPDFTPGLVDRMLAVIEYSELDALLVVNKMDLAGAPPAEVEIYRGLGYDVLLTSASDDYGIEELRSALKDKTSVVAGHSGVGKSSLLNALQPGLGLRVGDVNVVTRRGRHTTTAAVWLPLEAGGAVIDTAGIREFGLFGIPRRDVPWLFRDIAAVAPGCKYPDCLHLEEPGCMVVPAVEEGVIALFRYESYLRILDA